MAKEDLGLAVNQALDGGAPPVDPAGQALVALGQRLRATPPRSMMDPLARRAIRAGLLATFTNQQRQPALRYARFESPFGVLQVAYEGDVVKVCDLAVPDELFERECLARLGVRPILDDSPPARLQREVTQALETGRFRGNVDLSTLPAFQRRVLEETLKIRRGEIRTYNWIAREIGTPGASRAVGTALAHNPIPILIPCHRVVRSDYSIGEYGCGGPAKKREILALEQVNLDQLDRFSAQGIRFRGSATTHIFCLPGCYTGRRTKPEYQRTFRSAADAVASGFRACKVCKPA